MHEFSENLIFSKRNHVIQGTRTTISILKKKKKVHLCHELNTVDNIINTEACTIKPDASNFNYQS